MQPIHSRRLLGALLALAVSLTLVRSAAAADVYSVKFGFNGVTQEEVNGSPSVVKVKANQNGLINIARGRSGDAVVPANEVLAGVLDCDDALSLIVFDTMSSSVLATIATPMEHSSVGSGTKGYAVIAAGIASTGSPANSLDGGYLVFTAKAKLDALGCPVKVSASVNGTIDVTVTDDVGTHSETVLVLKGKLTLLSKIGTIMP